MSEASENSMSLEQLAGRLENDMLRKGLRPGDKYMIAREAGRFLDVSTSTAQRVLKVMARRNLLVRQRKSGTFVGPEFRPFLRESTGPLAIVHVLMAMDYYRTSDFPGNTFVDAIQDVIPSAAVQVHYMPQQNPLEYTRFVAGGIKQSGRQEGMILIRSTRAVQEYLVASDFYAVVLGSVYSGIRTLPWLDVDQVQTGRVMADYAISRGFGRIILLMRNEWRQGDNNLLNGVIGKMAEKGLSVDSLVISSVPCERNIIAQELETHLADLREPTAILCRSDYYANVVIESAAMKNLRYGKDFICISGSHMRTNISGSYPSIIPEVSIKDQVRTLAGILCRMVREPFYEKYNELVAVRLSEPRGIQI